jgi:hypothetical protein
MNSRTWRSASLIFAGLAILLTPIQSKASGRIVVAFDDWTLGNVGFFNPCEPGTFATNVAAWFTEGKPGRFLAWSTHAGYTGTDLASAMASAGHIWVVDHTASFTLTNLMTYDGVFVGGDAADTNMLIQYVEAGGNVYVFSGGAAANYLWNGFVGHFGLEFAGTTSGGTIYPMISTHPIFNGVDHLYGLNGTGDGTGVVDLDPSDPRNAVVASYQGTGLFAVWDGLAPVMSIRISATQGDRVAEVEADWSSRSNSVYQLQYALSLTISSPWANLGVPITAQGTNTGIRDAVPPGQGNKFYRVYLLP